MRDIVPLGALALSARPYDAADAGAICEVETGVSSRFVAANTLEQRSYLEPSAPARFSFDSRPA